MQFLFLFKLGNFLWKYEHFFFLKYSNLKLDLLQCAWKTILAIWQIWNQEDFTNLNFSTLQWIEKNMEAQTKLISKNPIFLNWKKIETLRTAFKNPKISLWIGKTFELQPMTNTQKSQFCIYGIIGKTEVLI